MNDPNGLLRLPDGELLLCYQFNPFGVEWGAMHWGSARSRDLLHWETGDIVLFPDEWGTIFSGSGWRDEENAAGFGPGALLFFYTSAGGTEAPWSRDGVSTQRLAVSLDGGRTLQKQPGLLLPNLAEGNRDPKVFYHPETGAYIMVLYLSEKDFAIFRSHDLIRWEQTQQLTLAPGWECPDLFRLPVEDGGEKWVFWTADGLYWVGSFDGFRFTPEQPCRCAYGSAIPYAAQTVSREPGRVLSLSWLRLPNDGRCSTGMQSIPMEFGLSHEGEEGFRLRMKPCRELWEAAERLPGDTVPAGPWAARGTAPAGGEAHLAFPGGGLTLDTSAGRVSLCGQSFEIRGRGAVPLCAPGGSRRGGALRRGWARLHGRSAAVRLAGREAVWERRSRARAVRPALIGKPRAAPFDPIRLVRTGGLYYNGEESARGGAPRARRYE